VRFEETEQAIAALEAVLSPGSGRE
jgi:hypothetical protein